MNKQEDNQQQLRFYTTNIKVLDSSRNRLFEITEREVRDSFKKLAGEKNIRVLNGTKGTVPRIVHTVEMLLKLWDSLDEQVKTRLIDSYVREYTENICSIRPDWIIQNKHVSRNTISAGNDLICPPFQERGERV